MSTYGLILLAIIAFPLPAAFLYRKIGFYRYFYPLTVSILTVGSVFILKDHYFTSHGIWYFNPFHVSGVKLLSIPVEEALFFVAVPFSCLFLYESIRAYFQEVEIKIYVKLGSYLMALLAFTSAYLCWGRVYSFMFALLVGIVFLAEPFIPGKLFKSGLYWFWMFLCFVLFLIFNYVLTSIPVVLYNSAHISNIRILTIPVEDFLYNFVMLTAYLWVYLLFKKRV